VPHSRHVSGSTPTVGAASDVVDPSTALAYDRTHLANERTFAAWLRTGLSVAAGGIAVAHLVPEPSRDSMVSLGLGAAFVVAGVGITAYGAHQFARLAEDLGRRGTLRHRLRPRVPYVLTAVIGVLLLAVLLFLWSHQGRPLPGHRASDVSSSPADST
jgi:putative membrane protein